MRVQAGAAGALVRTGPRAGSPSGAQGVLLLTLRALVAGTALALVASAAQAPAEAPAGDNLLEQARLAAERLSFNGLVQVVWRESTGSHSESLLVQAAGGTLEVKGDTTVMADGDRARMVRRQRGEWDLLWSGALGSAGRPDVSTKYALVPTGEAPVAGRPTTLVEVRRGEVVRQRLYLDRETNLLLRREQLNDAGSLERLVYFVTFSLDRASPAPDMPIRAIDHAAHEVSPRDLSPSFPAPAALDLGYRRIGTFAEGQVVHVLYSDGLYDLSVFEQRGRLEPRDVPPGGRRQAVGGARAWAFAWPGGNLLLWHAGHNVYTAVSDAPLADLLGVARSLPSTGRPPSLADRLRRACHALVAPLG